MANNGQEPISAEEFKRLGEALKDDKFRQLLLEYAEEIRDPQNRQRYEQELSILERERGIDLTFIHPEAGYVIKTSTSDAVKTFVNICKNKHVAKPSCNRSKTRAGLDWSVPYFLSPHRDDIDKSGRKCRLYDVVFHPDTLYLAQRNARFRKMIEDTALEGIQQKFQICLDQKNLHYPKLKYKGHPFPTVLRKPCSLTEEISQKLKGTTLYDSTNPKNKTTIAPIIERKPEPVLHSEPREPIEPRYSLRYRNNVDMEDFTVLAQQSPNMRPDVLVIDIHLPLLNSAKGVDLDIDKQMLNLSYNGEVIYQLHLNLPYPVNDANGSAQFDQTSKTLTVILPVYPFEPPTASEDDVDINQVDNDSEDLTVHLDEDLIKSQHHCTMGNLCLPAHAYYLPAFDVNQTETNVTFIFHVSNTDVERVAFQICDCSYGFQIVFSSAEQWYSFCVKCDERICRDDLLSDSCENNIVVRISKAEGLDWRKFKYGCYDPCSGIYNFVNRTTVFEKLKALEDATRGCLTNAVSIENENVEVRNVSEASLELMMRLGECVNHQSSEADSEGEDFCETSLSEESTKNRTSSESSLDLCPLPGRRGILKYPRNWRSVSESSDDFGCSSPLDLLPPSPEEEENLLDDQNMPKKNVRFNDCVSKNIFRANSSILGQKKKNQKRAQYKKRLAQRSSSQEETESQDSTATAEDEARSSPSKPKKKSRSKGSKKDKCDSNSESDSCQTANDILSFLVEESNAQKGNDGEVNTIGNVDTGDRNDAEGFSVADEDINTFVEQDNMKVANIDANKVEDDSIDSLKGNQELAAIENGLQTKAMKVEIIKEQDDFNSQIKQEVEECETAILLTEDVNISLIADLEKDIDKSFKSSHDESYNGIPEDLTSYNDISAMCNAYRTCGETPESLDFRTSCDEVIQLVLPPDNTAFHLD